MNWITEHKIPLGQWMENFVDWLIGNAAGFFDAIAYSLEWLILGATDLLLMCPAFILIAATAGLAWWLHRSLGLVAFVAASLLLIANLGYWTEMIETLVLVLSATVLCVLIGIPIGIMAAHYPKFYTAIRPVLDLMHKTFKPKQLKKVIITLSMAPKLLLPMAFMVISS